VLEITNKEHVGLLGILEFRDCETGGFWKSRKISNDIDFTSDVEIQFPECRLTFKSISRERRKVKARVGRRSSVKTFSLRLLSHTQKGLQRDNGMAAPSKELSSTIL
jgi:hypothetical protein